MSMKVLWSAEPSPIASDSDAVVLGLPWHWEDLQLR